MTSNTDSITAKIAENSFGLAMNDGPWRAIGYGIRPSRGVFWRLTTPQWKKALEQRIYRELLVIITSAHIVGFSNIKDDLLRRLVDFYWGDNGRLISQYFSKLALSAAITEYVEMPAGEWPTLFINHLGLSAVPDQELRTRMLAKAIHFAIDVTNIIPMVRSFGLDMACWGTNFRAK